MPRFDGVDVAYPQRINDWGAYLAAGQPSLVIAKCSEGNYSDPFWAHNIEGMRRAGIRRRGGYHFLTTDRHSMETQAQAILRAWDPYLPLQRGESLWLDRERDGGHFPTAELAQELRERLVPIFGRKRIALYTGPAWVADWNGAGLHDMVLWASGGWTDEGQTAAGHGAALWQFGGYSSIDVPGIAVGGGVDTVDVNMVLDEAKLDEVFGLEGDDDVTMSLIQPPALLPDGTPNPRSGEVWIAFGLFRAPVPTPSLLNVYKYIGIPGPNRLTQEWFDNLVPVDRLLTPAT